MPRHRVELYVGFTGNQGDSGTWNTEVVEIEVGEGTEDRDIVALAIDDLHARKVPFAFAGLYSGPHPIEEDEEN